MKNYEINTKTLAIIPISEKKTKVIEENDEFIVENSAFNLIDESCKFFGSSYDGRVRGAKNLINVTAKIPILIEESRKIIFFPTTSSRLKKCTWISLNNLYEYHSLNKTTDIIFCCGKKINIPFSYGVIDNQILRATRLLYVLNSRINKKLKK